MRFIGSFKECLAPDVQRELGGGRAVGVTIGNFDGMHLGHQALFSRLHEETSALPRPDGRPPVKILLTFFPHPRMLLDGSGPREWNHDERFWLVHPLARRIELAALYGMDYLVRLKFSRNFAALTPQQFVRQYLVEALHACVVVVGEDWRFGAGRQGDVQLLARLGAECGLRAAAVPPVILDNQRVSTSLVKDAVRRGDFAQLRRLLGRNFEYSAKVRHGEKRGRTLGYPTANLLPHRQLLPPDGVYATCVHLDSLRLPSVTNIGCRPTFGRSVRLVETHILDGMHELYGKRIRVEFIARIRGEQKFDSAEDLCRQMELDVRQARSILAGA